MRTVLVTGAQGLLGSYLVPMLSKTHRVFAMGRRSAPVDLGSNVTPLIADLLQPLDVGALPEPLNAVIYLAQSPRFREFPGGAADMFQVNVAQPLALLEYARRVGAQSFVYASTGGVYTTSDRPLREDSPAEAAGYYFSSKISAELLARNYGSLLNVILVRYFFVYGHGQKRDMLLPRLVDSVREGRPVTLQGEDGIRLNPIHATDAARATMAALSLRGMYIVNVAGPETLSIRRICEIAASRIGKRPVFHQEPAIQPRHMVADIGRMRQLLGEPSIRFEGGVSDVL